MNKEIDFSVIIPTHNRWEMLKRAVESIRAQGEKTQIIIVNDASTDRTDEMIRDMSKEGDITYIRNERTMFASESRRRGYKAAQGRFVAFMDDDDYYTDGTYFRKVREVMDHYHNVSTVIGRTFVTKAGKYIVGPELGGEGLIPQREYFNGFLFHYNKPNSSLTAFFRRESMDMAGFAEAKILDDTCIYLNGLLGGDTWLHSQEVAAYYVHDSNISSGRLPWGFMYNTMEEKNRIYKLACEKGILDKPKDWLWRQQTDSGFFFLEVSGRDIKLVIPLMLWWMFRGKGTQFRFLRWLIFKIADRLAS